MSFLGLLVGGIAGSVVACDNAYALSILVRTASCSTKRGILLEAWKLLARRREVKPPLLPALLRHRHGVTLLRVRWGWSRKAKAHAPCPFGSPCILPSNHQRFPRPLSVVQGLNALSVANRLRTTLRVCLRKARLPCQALRRPSRLRDAIGNGVSEAMARPGKEGVLGVKVALVN